MLEALQQEQIQAPMVDVVLQDRPWQRCLHSPAGPFAGSFGRAGSGTGCACFTGSPGDCAGQGPKVSRGKHPGNSFTRLGLTPASQGCGGAGAQCPGVAAPAAGCNLDRVGMVPVEGVRWPDLKWARAEQDPPSARGSRQGALVCAPCRLSPWALVSGCSCSQHGTSAEPGPWPSEMCHVQQCSACPATAHRSRLPHTPAPQQEQTDRAWRQMDKPAHSLPCVQAERHDRDPAPEIHTWGKLLLAHRGLMRAFGMLVSIHASQVRQNGVLRAIALLLLGHHGALEVGPHLSHGSFPPWVMQHPRGRQEAAWCPCQQQDVRNTLHLILPWLPAGHESCLRNGDMCLGMSALS